MKFNLKSFAEKNKSNDQHVLNEGQLERDRSKKAPEVVTEKQLERDRVPEKEVILEKLLDAKRNGGSDTIVERSLNESNSKLVQHRNTSAYAGDINKLEEKRLSKKTMESEKYTDSITTPKKKRWWENLKADSNKKIVTAQYGDEMRFDDDNFGRLRDTWSEEEGVMGDDDFDITEFDVPDSMYEETGVEALSVDKIKPVNINGKRGLFVSFDIDPSANASVEELQETAYNKIISQPGYEYLKGVSEFSPLSFRITGDKVVAGLMGEEYYPEGKESYMEEEEDLGLEAPMMKLTDFQTTDVGGVIVGKVSVDPDYVETLLDMDNSQILREIQDLVNEKDETVSVEMDGIDLDKLAEGEINFVGQKSVTKSKPESYDKVKGEPIASNDFDIIVLSDTKKN